MFIFLKTISQRCFSSTLMGYRVCKEIEAAPLPHPLDGLNPLVLIWSSIYLLIYGSSRDTPYGSVMAAHASLGWLAILNKWWDHGSHKPWKVIHLGEGSEGYTKYHHYLVKVPLRTNARATKFSRKCGRAEFMSTERQSESAFRRTPEKKPQLSKWKMLA